ncbi:MAG: hypothetical protein F4Z95_05315 [Gammaproteobacteria bacterium]|nr:hypothetical protein [Gammaproteobacteria bacterium]MYC23065.1 hypothetical protein [Caldilineaceae bacterium SB0662_bin_25]
MQPTRDGPDIPEQLLQLNEDGRVVFFCGAGISRPADLPLFGDLVGQIFEGLHHEPNQVQQRALDADQFDTAIGLLESEIADGRLQVRRKLAEILTPDLTKPAALATHQALMTLARNRQGHTRLITTNYDRLFEEVMSACSIDIETFSAPLLPVPKSRWKGLVYLHGLLAEEPEDSELDRLVLSSGDFGLAYLTERWAARFLSELFRNFTVCFIGYSIEDPVLRYMVDALAADRLLGEAQQKMFAFDGFTGGNEKQARDKWDARDITPILYCKENDHTHLHDTLQKWANIHEGGVYGKERIVIENANLLPHASTTEDNFADRILWALSDQSGLPAKKFARTDPVPPLDWLDRFCDRRYGYENLLQFGVAPDEKPGDKIEFSFIRRPTPYQLAEWMGVVWSWPMGGGWDDVMIHLAEWLTRHLDDPDLVLWVARRGGQLHPEFARRVKDRMTRLDEFERKGESEKLEQIRAHAPRAVPSPAMRTVWSLILGGRVGQSRSISLYDWWGRFQSEGLTAALRLEFRELLEPRILFHSAFPWGDDKESADSFAEVAKSLRWDFELASNHVHHALSELTPNRKEWCAALPELLPDFSNLLRDTMDLMRDLNEANDKNDYSHVYMQSIAEHDQNSRVQDWTALIELSRDAWIATAKSAPDQARVMAERWNHEPYPVFKRLCFFAAIRTDIIPHQQAINWLLADSAWWLWSSNTKREAIRLLVALGPALCSELKIIVEQAILEGPPRNMYRDDVSPEHFKSLIERPIWLRLAKLKAAKVRLGKAAQSRLDDIASRNPRLCIQEDESDEFRMWSGSVDIESEVEILPRNLIELVARLEERYGED